MEGKKAEGTCGQGGCGIHCGCCACKAIKGLVLLLIGVAIGYGIAHCCRGRRVCRTEGAVAAQEATPPPAAPAKAR